MIFIHIGGGEYWRPRIPKDEWEPLAKREEEFELGAEM